MNPILRSMLALVLLVGAARDTAAQWNVARFGTTNPNQMYVSFGADPALIASVGYARDVRIAGQPWQLGVEAHGPREHPWTGPGRRWRASSGGCSVQYGSRGARAPSRLVLASRRTAPSGDPEIRP